MPGDRKEVEWLGITDLLIITRPWHSVLDLEFPPISKKNRLIMGPEDIVTKD